MSTSDRYWAPILQPPSSSCSSCYCCTIDVNPTLILLTLPLDEPRTLGCLRSYAETSVSLKGEGDDDPRPAAQGPPKPHSHSHTRVVRCPRSVTVVITRQEDDDGDNESDYLDHHVSYINHHRSPDYREKLRARRNVKERCLKSFFFFFLVGVNV